MLFFDKIKKGKGFRKPSFLFCSKTPTNEIQPKDTFRGFFEMTKTAFFLQKETVTHIFFFVLFEETSKNFTEISQHR